MKVPSKKLPDRARHCTNIGQFERLVGISTHEERFAFWRQYAHLGDDAFDAARAELYRRIEALPATQTREETK